MMSCERESRERAERTYKTPSFTSTYIRLSFGDVLERGVGTIEGDGIFVMR
jgi:hypothetical protein